MSSFSIVTPRRAAVALPLVGYALWTVETISGQPNRMWMAALLVYAAAACALGAYLSGPKGRDFLTRVDRRADRLAIGLIAVFALALIAVNVLQSHFFAPGVYAEDTAYYGQLLWNTLRGDILVGNLVQERLYSPPVHSDFALHISPVLFALLPVYAVAPDHLTLLILRDIALAAAAWPLYTIARDRMGGAVAIAALLLYLSNPIIVSQGLSAFYLLQLAPLALFFALRAYLRKQFKVFLLWMLAGLTLREDVAITFAGFGVLALLQRYPLRWVLAGAAVPVFWWGFATLVALPAFGRLGKNSFDVALAGGSETPLGAYRVLLTEPGWILEAFANDGAQYLLRLLAWAAYVGPFGAEGVLAAPGAAAHLFLGRVSIDGLDVYSRFAVLPASALVAASVLVVARLRARRPSVPPGFWVSCLLLLPAVSVLDGNKDLVQRTLIQLATENDRDALTEALALIPEDASVAAPQYALPHLANRPKLYYLEELYMYPDPSPEYYLVDKNRDRLWLNAQRAAEYPAFLERLFESTEHEVIWSHGDYALLRRRATF